MTDPNKFEHAPWSLRDIAIQCLLGLAFGVLFVAVPLSYFQYFSPDKVLPIHLICSAIFVLGCGLLSATWGSKFLQLLSNLIESMPSI
jgi:hypothetical protein